MLTTPTAETQSQIPIGEIERERRIERGEGVAIAAVSRWYFLQLLQIQGQPLASVQLSIILEIMAGLRMGNDSPNFHNGF